MLLRSHVRVYSDNKNHSDILNKFSDLPTVFAHQAPLLSRSDQSDVFKHNIDAKTYYIKRYYKTTGALSWFGYSRFKREARNQDWFNQLGIPSAKLILVAEQRFLFKTTQAFLITEGLDNTTDLATITARSPRFFNSPLVKHLLIDRTATILQQLHQHSFCHNDLHWRNLLVETDSSQINVYLIDCPSGRFLFWPLIQYKKIKDLFNLDKQAPEFFTYTQRMRFFKRYRGIKQLTLADKKMIHAVLKRREQRQLRKQKSGVSLLWHQLKVSFFQ